MTKYAGNFYKYARNQAGMSVEFAAQELAVSGRSLLGYENGTRPVPNEVAVSMMNIYQAPWLGYIHLQKTSDLGAKLLPSFNCYEGIASGAIQVEIASQRLMVSVKELLEIAADDKVDDYEEERFEAIQELLKSIIGSLMKIVMYGHKKRTTGAGTPVVQKVFKTFA